MGVLCEGVGEWRDRHLSWVADYLLGNRDTPAPSLVDEAVNRAPAPSRKASALTGPSVLTQRLASPLPSCWSACHCLPGWGAGGAENG